MDKITSVINLITAIISFAAIVVTVRKKYEINLVSFEGCPSCLLPHTEQVVYRLYSPTYGLCKHSSSA